MHANIYNIQRFSLHDGGGIRTIVFFKGCPLRCAWCSNPESQRSAPELMYNQRLCLRCGTCVLTCPEHALALGEQGVLINRQQCAGMGHCAEVCPANALHQMGKQMDVNEIIDLALVDKPYYDNSAGGVTLSGGEPLAQAEAALHILTELNLHAVHTAVETSAFVDADTLRKAVPCVSQFIVDFKLADPEKHRRYTGVDNAPILENVRLLHGWGASIVLRLPLIPGINMNEEHYDGVCALINELGLPNVEVLPFHQYGRGKYAELGRDYACADINPPARAAMQQAKEYISARTKASVY